MKSMFYGWVGRLVRSAVAIFVAGLVATYGDSPVYMGIAPLLLSGSKWLRDKYGFDLKVI